MKIVRDLNAPSRERAACADQDTDLFFGPDRDEHEETQVDARSRTARAKRICSTCPVRMQCLVEALENNETHGIWGGMTARERRQLVRAAR